MTRDDVVGSLRPAIVPLAAADDAYAVDPTLVRELVADARVVGLGESTHGTHEFFVLKRRIIEICVRDLGFRAVCFEAPSDLSQAADGFVVRGEGTATSALERNFWCWNTAEVADVLDWLRDWNTTHPARSVRFVGCDLPYDAAERPGHGGDREQAMASGVLATHEREGRTVLWVHNAHLQRGRFLGADTMGQHLHRALGDGFRGIGFGFSDGEFCAFHRTTGLRRFRVDVPPDDSLAAVFARLGAEAFVLRLDRIERRSAAGLWLGSRPETVMIGQQWDDEREGEPEGARGNWDPRGQYDALVWVRTTSASRVRLLGD